MYMIKKASEISGVSVRTLHHYDEIGLLSPQKAKNGSRYYRDEDMAHLQMILFYKYLGFPLKEIKSLLEKEGMELLDHLNQQLLLLEKEKMKLLVLIDTLEKTIAFHERKIAMPIKEKFKGFSYQDYEKYETEAIAEYVKDTIEKAKNKQRGKEEIFTATLNQIFIRFAENMKKGISPSSEENHTLSKSLHEWICQYSFECPKEVFWGIGERYVSNEHFKNNIDQFGEGTAEYISESIKNM